MDCLPSEARRQASVIWTSGVKRIINTTNGQRNGILIDSSSKQKIPLKFTRNGAPMPGIDPAVAQALRLQALVEDDKLRESYLEIRHVVDVFDDFPSSRPTVQQVLSCLRGLQPRLYSISTSPLEGAAQVGITVAEVRYKAYGKDRVGVASTCVSDRLKVGDFVPVYVSRNPDFRLPPDLVTPIIMVGPGTGVAPFRAFIHERIKRSVEEGVEPGPSVLYFGCRRRDQDFLYGDLLDAWAAKGVITLHTAFSREQACKVYVQHRLKETSDMVWKLLEDGAHFYVCGDASSMAGQVERALLDIIESHRPDSDPQCYLDGLVQENRYQRDVWF